MKESIREAIVSSDKSLTQNVSTEGNKSLCCDYMHFTCFMSCKVSGCGYLYIVTGNQKNQTTKKKLFRHGFRHSYLSHKISVNKNKS